MCARCGRLMIGIPCPHCGQEHTRAGALFCEHCGGDIREATAKAAANRGAPPPPAAGVSNGAAAEAGLHQATVTDLEIQVADDEVDDDDEVAGEAPAAPEAPWQAPTAVRAAPAARVHSAPPEQPALGDQPPPRHQVATGTPEATSPEDRRAPKGYAARRVQAQRSQRRSSPASVVALVIIIGLILGAVWTTYLRAQGRSDAATSPAKRAVASPAGAVSASPRQAPTPPIGATLKVTTSPAEAQVELDGRPVGTTRLTMTGLKPGAHKVKISKAGYRSIVREFTVVMLETITLDLALTPVPQPASRQLPPPPPPPPP